MGDPHRFHAFADVVTQHIPRSSMIADVAGGKGYLQAALRERGFRRITSWDRRGRTSYNRHGHRYGWFTVDIPTRYDAVVAMHPDEATDHCILYAARHRLSALISPCCVKPSAVGFWHAHTYALWCAHLERLAHQHQMTVTWTTMPINGRNDVMILTPKAGAAI
jgi:hypothetical protein